MPRFEYDLAGQTAHVEVSDGIAPAYRADPRYVEVTDVDGRYLPVDLAAAIREEAAERAEAEARVAELAGPRLDAAVKAAKLEHPSNLSADEKRQALVEQQLAGPQDADPEPGTAGDTEKE